MSVASLILGLLGCIIVKVTKYRVLLTLKPNWVDDEIIACVIIIFILSTLSIIFGGCGVAKSNRTGAPKALAVAGLVMGIYSAIFVLYGILNLALD